MNGGNDYICYILRCDNYTYNGCTNNFKRRLRQHNREIKGGAKCTSRRGPWKPICIIEGFKDQREALQAEWRIKRVEGRRRPRKYCGPGGRIKGLVQILKREQFTSKSERLICDIPLKIYLEEEYLSILKESEVAQKENIEINDLSEKLRIILQK